MVEITMAGATCGPHKDAPDHAKEEADGNKPRPKNGCKRMYPYVCLCMFLKRTSNNVLRPKSWQVAGVQSDALGD